MATFPSPPSRSRFPPRRRTFCHHGDEARDGEEGPDSVRKLAPGLVISDILMPTMNGYEFVSRLRQFSGFERVPVIFQAPTFLEHETQTLGRACGVSDYMGQPCDPEKLW